MIYHDIENIFLLKAPVDSKISCLLDKIAHMVFIYQNADG